MKSVQILTRFPTHQSCMEHLEWTRWKGCLQCSYYLSELTKRNSVSRNDLQLHVDQFCYRFNLRNTDPN